jgi:hypothetical protein
MRSTSLLAILAVAVLGASFAGDAPLRLAARAPLTAEHDGAGTIADLPAGTPVAVLQRDGDRVRVRVEGWIPASALPGETAALGVPPTGNSAPATSIQGAISLAAPLSRRRTGAGAQVWLLPAGTGGFAEGDEEARLDALASEMATLQTAAKKALEGGPNFAEATRKHDQIMADRRRAERERDDLVAGIHARHEGVALRAAVASGFADEHGAYKVEAPAGAYLLYARFLRGDLDVEWIETVTLPSKLDLDETRARHFAR